MRTRQVGAALLLCVCLPACGTSDPAISPCEQAFVEQVSSRRVVTADWLNRTLSIFSYDRIAARCTPEQSRLRTIDLGSHSPGPLQLEIAPDGRTALVSIGPGFFADAAVLVGSPDIPPGGGLLVVDLIDGTVLHEIATKHVPMGIAIHPDGTRGYSANYGQLGKPGDTVSVVDMQSGAVIEEVIVGSLPEQISLSPDGSFGLVNMAAENAVRTFASDDVAGSLSDPLSTGSDPSDIAVLSNKAVVANSQAFSVAVLDVSVPTKPTLTETVQLAGIPYGASIIPGTSTILVTTQLGSGSLQWLDVSNATALLREPIALEGGSFPLGVAVDADGALAFVAHPTDQTLSVVDLATRTVRTLSLPLSATGPTYVAVGP